MQCTLRLPEEYLDELRALAARHRTSNGGAVMVLVDAVHAFAARSGMALDTLLRDIAAPSTLETPR